MASSDLIDTLIAEAGGEGEAGLIAAAWAIQQRAAARGQTVDQVIKSGFDGYSNPGSGAQRAQRDPALRAKVERIVQGVQSGSIPNPVPGADHFLSGDAMPGWAKNMKPVATIGGHRFYASGQVPQEAYGPLIPPGELPSVATALDTEVPAVYEFAPNGRPRDPDNGFLMAQDDPRYAEALRGSPNPPRVAPTPATQSNDMRLMRNPMMSTTAAQASQFSGDPGTPAQGQVVATIPSLPGGPQFSASDRVRGSNGYQTIASIPSTPQPQQVSASDLTRGRSGISTVASIPSVPQTSASDMARGNNAWQTIASIPSSPIGQPPATRAVQSVPVTPQRPMSYAGQDRASPTVQLPSLPALPPLQGFDNPNKGQERLVANAFPAAPGGDATALTPLSAFATTPQLPAFPSITAGIPPLPRQRPSSPLEQARMMVQPLTIPNGMPVTSAQLPGMHLQQVRQQMPQQRVVPRPLMSGGLSGMLMPRAPARAVVQGGTPMDVNNHSPAQIAAMRAGKSGYVGSDGGVQPVYAMNGKLRNTY